MAGKKPTYWVSMTDTFLSGWGPADNKINKLVLACENYEEAKIVAANARGRGEMKYVNICITKPYYNASAFLVSRHDKEDYHNWYIRGFTGGGNNV